MKKSIRASRFGTPWTRALAGLGLVGACTVVDKGDYTFTDHPEDTGGAAGDGAGGTGKGGASGSSSGSAGKGGISGDAGDGSGAVGGTAGTSGGDAGAGTGGGDGGLCDPNPCLHGGTCTDDGVKANCDCAPGYEGTTCATNTNECMPMPCQHGAACTDLVNDYKCDCAPMDAGKNCDLPRFQVIPAPGPNGMPPPPGLLRAVSADGSIAVGHFTDAQTYTHPFAWSAATNSQPLPLGNLIRVFAYTFGLSGDGLRWVGGFGQAANGPYKPMGGKATDAQVFVLPSGAPDGAAFDTDMTGAKAIGYYSDSMNVSHAAVWTDATTEPAELPNPFGNSTFCRAGAITRDGRIVTGTAKDTTGGVFVISWADAGVSPVPGTRRPPSGTVNIDVHGVSSDAMIAVGSMTDTAFAELAFVAQNTTVQSIAPMNGAVPARSTAWDMSDDGTVIVGESQINMAGVNAMQAAVWTNVGGVWQFQPLFDYMRGANIQLPMDFKLLAAYGVSADGKTIVGAATDPMSIAVGFIVRMP